MILLFKLYSAVYNFYSHQTFLSAYCVSVLVVEETSLPLTLRMQSSGGKGWGGGETLIKTLHINKNCAACCEEKPWQGEGAKKMEELGH